ncbi:ComEA family DNA-binding protein [Humisphaera borealis]|uniref:Uncharacterized protein n=1 Tax=Humisphaera borealis TaxID=2807512 RepID=A0A7M2X2D3_9BACT|nr:hypothetical protein [Humisphaera borealis]QOV91769.1 hypothetical protein IPV69_10600 [Humisphaera borealis]
MKNATPSPAEPRPMMTRLRSAFGLLNAAHRRFRRARSGSVLILVIALLVLLALIGTAFITTTGNDRDAATQHKYNTQIEMLVQGVKDLMINAIVTKVAPTDLATGKATYRPAIPLSPDPSRPVQSPPTTNVVPKQFANIDYLPWDAILADRTPSGVQPAGPNTVATAARWQYISASPLATNRDPVNPGVFPNQFRSPLVTTNNPEYYSSRFRVEASYISATLPNGQVRLYPAFIILDPADPNNGKTVMAADSDGDGIADAGLFELPVGQIDGVRYFAAIRIVDNAAAINASVAWENWRSQFAEDARLVGNFTPANIELQRLVEGPAYTDGPDSGRFQAFQMYRQGDQTYSNLRPVRDDGNSPYFQWATRYDAFYFGLGQRLDNPGLNLAGVKFRSLGLAESASMAYRFTLANPLGSQSVLEQYFPNSTRMAAVNRQPFTPDQSVQWFNTIFNTGYIATNARPIRPWVVAHNPVSNAVPSFTSDPTDPLPGALPPGMDPKEIQRNGQYRYRGNWDAATLYHIGEWVKHGGRSYVAIANHGGLQPATGNGLRTWAEVPWNNQPVKLNPNTANFGSLMAAYWAVMADGPLVKPTGNLDAGYGGGDVWTFGDVVRPSGGGAVPLQPYYVKQLRAALAAVNTIDIRDQDDDVTSRTVTMSAMDGTNAITARVYGTERQPFITEAMVHITKEDVPYVMIELYNPHEAPITLTAFKACYRDRGTGAITQIGSLAGKTIPARGYLYLESNKSRRPTSQAGAFPADSVITEMPLLDDLVNPNNETPAAREFVLMRTRRYDGTATSSANPANLFDESALEQQIPVDQLEFFDISYGDTLGANRVAPEVGGPQPMPPNLLLPIADRYHYRRANTNQPANAWHSVYSGPYNRNPPANERHQRGWVRDPRPSALTPDDEMMLTPAGFGNKTMSATAAHNNFAGAANASTYRTRTLQANSAGMGGPWKGIVSTNVGTFSPVTPPNATLPDNTTSAPAFPFGGFARTGDILQVTFVGGYRIEQGTFFEMNSISVDAAFAEDGDMNDDDQSGGTGATNSLEQLGRFCPIVHGGIDDVGGKPNPLAPLGNQRYAWAADIFDYFSVLSPQDDYYPNIDPAVGADPTLSVATPKWPGGNTGAPYQPQPVPNTVGSTYTSLNTGVREDTAANHGLINLNTAPPYVIAQIPFTTNRQLNEDIAFAIVTHRNNQGPFRSLFDLMKVTIPGAPYTPLTSPPNGPGAGGFIMEGNWGAVSALDPTLVHGDITPYATNLSSSGGDDRVAGDFEARYLLLNRISNMVCFRSDSFTAYVVVQGWRNAGTSLPELVAQRRAAIIIDRSTVVPNLSGPVTGDVQVTSPSITNVPQN